MPRETTAEEIEYNIRDLADKLKLGMPEDVGFAVFLFHKGEGVVGYTTNVPLDKLSRILTDWQDRAKRAPNDA